MSETELAHRFIASQARVSSDDLRKGRVKRDRWPKVLNAIEKLASAPIYLDDSSDIGVLEMRAKARRLHARSHGLGLIVVDYLQLVRPEGTLGQPRRAGGPDQPRAEDPRPRARHPGDGGVAALARGRGPHPPLPMLSDLRESGQLEQDADVVMFVYREEYYDERVRPHRRGRHHRRQAPQRADRQDRPHLPSQVSALRQPVARAHRRRRPRRRTGRADAAPGARRGAAAAPSGACDGSTWIFDEELGEARPCRCRERRVRQAVSGGLGTGIGRRFLEVSFEREPIVSLDPVVLRQVRAFVRSIDDHLEAGRGLWFYGPVGTGKTSLAVLVAKAAKEAGRSYAVYPVPRLLAEIKRTYDRDSSDTYLGVFRRLCSVDLLVLDDLGWRSRPSGSSSSSTRSSTSAGRTGARSSSPPTSRSRSGGGHRRCCGPACWRCASWRPASRLDARDLDELRRLVERLERVGATVDEPRGGGGVRSHRPAAPAGRLADGVAAGRDLRRPDPDHGSGPAHGVASNGGLHSNRLAGPGHRGRPMGRRGEGQGRRPARRAGRPRDALSGRQQRRPHDRARRRDVQVPPGALRASSTPASCARSATAWWSIPKVLTEEIDELRRRRVDISGLRDLRQLPPDHALPPAARPRRRGAARQAADRHHPPRHRPLLCGQGRPARDPDAGPARREDPAQEDLRGDGAQAPHAAPVRQGPSARPAHDDRGVPHPRAPPGAVHRRHRADRLAGRSTRAAS